MYLYSLYINPRDSSLIFYLINKTYLLESILIIPVMFIYIFIRCPLVVDTALNI